MNLLVDCHCFDSKMSQGITTYIKGIYSNLPSLAPEFDFYFVAEDIDKLKRIFGIANNIHYIPLTSKNRLYRLLFEIPRIIKENNIDVAHFQYVSPLIKKCKTIVTLHDILFIDYPQYFPFSYRISKALPFKLSAKQADLLCTVSNYSKNRIADVFNINKNDIYITPNAVDPEFYEIHGDKPVHFPEKYILYVSRIEPRKNHKSLVEAYKRLDLAKKGYKLVFIGKETVPTPELHEAMEKLDSNIKDNIILIAQSSFSELKLWYKYADLFVYPTLAEGFGIPPLEAAAAGVPVICNEATAMEEFTFFRNNLIDITNQELLETTIENALREVNQCDLSDISNTIENKYNWKAIASNFQKIIEQKFISDSH